jgi:hypothetical protein
MTLRRIAIVLGLLALALPALAAAQGLGDAAAREREKRQAAKKPAPAKVYTDDDLAEGRPPGTSSADGANPSSTTSMPEAASPAPEQSSPEADRRAEDQQYVEAVTTAQARVAQVEKRIQELQARLNPMSTTFIYGDFSGLGGDKVAEEAEVKAELAQAEVELNAARQAVVDATRARDAFRQARPDEVPQGRPGSRPVPQ